MKNRIEEEYNRTEIIPVRLNKYISDAGICSRREADRLIEAGKVKIDGVTASCGGGRAEVSAKSMFSKFRSFSTEITSQLLTQLLSDAVEPTLHGAGR